MRIISYLQAKVRLAHGKYPAPLTIKYSNLPKEYIERSYQHVYYRTPMGYPQYLPKEIKRVKVRFTTNAPWTQAFQLQNILGSQRKKVFVEPPGEWKFFKGDRVEVLVGKDKGKQGLINQVIQERNWVFVEGLNTHIRKLASDKDYVGSYVRSEAPLLVTNQVKLVDPESLLATDIEWRYTEEGERVRVSLSTGKIIPVPKKAEETYDYKVKSAYIENTAKDTLSDQIKEITYTPCLKTFEMDIMDEMGIKEDRIPAKSYWY